MAEEIDVEIKHLTVQTGTKTVINDVSFSLYKGEVLALVGESGSGKTMTALSVLDLLPPELERVRGEIFFNGRNIFDMGREEIRKIRGKEISMVFQEPFTALNPVMNIGTQLSETLIAHGCFKPTPSKVHGPWSIVPAFAKASEGRHGPIMSDQLKHLLSTVKLLDNVLTAYPHELSGGMRQRVMIAMALSCGPSVLILDEPTTALDVSIQKEILDLIKNIQKERALSVLFITHDLSIVNLIADRVCVMRQGKLIEIGMKEKVLNAPEHEYTKMLLGCIPRLGDTRERLPCF
ncbi:MAG: ABC transporter ATP-binding protein [Candidatus Omnitrophica bacterium]|nr:ABC transporter ATP-binding protein [Candidatus Omnitrophota bacterium]